MKTLVSIIAGISGVILIGLAIYYGVWRTLVNFVKIFTSGEPIHHIGLVIYDIISALLYRYIGVILLGAAASLKEQN